MHGSSIRSETVSLQENENISITMYLPGQLTINEIAVEVGASFHTLRAFIAKEKWPAKRKAFEAELWENWRLQAAGLMNRHILTVLKRHLSLAEKMDAAIKKTLEGSLSPRELESLAKALKSSADVAARAVGLRLRSCHSGVLPCTR